MIAESLPRLIEAPVPVQTHALGIEDRLARWDLKRLAASFVIAGQSNGFDWLIAKKPVGWLPRHTDNAW